MDDAIRSASAVATNQSQSVAVAVLSHRQGQLGEDGRFELLDILIAHRRVGRPAVWAKSRWSMFVGIQSRPCKFLIVLGRATRNCNRRVGSTFAPGGTTDNARAAMPQNVASGEGRHDDRRWKLRTIIAALFPRESNRSGSTEQHGAYALSTMVLSGWLHHSLAERRTTYAVQADSADCHLDLPWLPAELFISEAKRELQACLMSNGPHWATKAGSTWG
jgi:hypothetical protein